jgi:polysaccharide biosynthesis protein PslH
MECVHRDVENGPLKFLFFKPSFSWPFESGHDVHTFHMMKALAAAGQHVGLVTSRKPPPPVLASLSLDFDATLDCVNERAGSETYRRLGAIQERFRSYWGVPTSSVSGMSRIATDFGADVVVVSGLEVLPMIAGVGDGPLRIWYAADEWVLHHLTQVRPFDTRSWHNVRDAAIKGLYERAFSGRLDRAWAVSVPDRQALRWIAGIPDVDVLANGVDADHYQPNSADDDSPSAVFWGRLDFGPNIQALEWFCSRVWPGVISTRPDARFTIIGFKPSSAVTNLERIPGITIKPNLADIRPEVARHSVVVLPFVSGGGIKNKLLEAAAMGKAILCTRRALSGVCGDVPALTGGDAGEWVQHLNSLWAQPRVRRELGARARNWVVRTHTWSAAAEIALAGVRQSLLKRRTAVELAS